MAISGLELSQDRARSNWVRLRTLVVLRWVAIFGQIAALIVAALVFDLRIPVGPLSLAIGISVLVNLFSTFLAPENKRLSETEATLLLLFDLLQLGLLLYLTGGLNNPFALLALVPVTIAATFLQLRATILIGAVSLTMLTLLSQFFVPVMTASGLSLQLPGLFLFGFWVSLLIGVIFLGLYARQVTNEMHSMGEALFATQMALSREQKLTDLGGVVAAAAHELGTPLATIKLVSAELIEELSDRPDLHEDVALIRAQTDRCRDILRSMGRAGKDDAHLRRVPLGAIIEEAAEPHIARGKEVLFETDIDTEHPNRQPVIFRRPEIVHGIRNLIQNAVDFAETTVVVESGWDSNVVRLRISDDGPGFPGSVMARIGDPFMRRRRSSENRSRRPGYEGMGLGLFIAKTLLERTGAQLTFSNGGGRDVSGKDGGAIVLVTWPRDAVDPTRDAGRGALGDNKPIKP